MKNIYNDDDWKMTREIHKNNNIIEYDQDENIENQENWISIGYGVKVIFMRNITSVLGISYTKAISIIFVKGWKVPLGVYTYPSYRRVRIHIL